MVFIYCCGLVPALLGGCSAARTNALREDLLATDAAWAEAAAGNDVERIASYWTEDAVVYLAGRPPVVGKEALTNMVLRGRSTPGFSIRWNTFDSRIARSGDMANTLATYEISARSPDGTLVTQRGTSICSWRRENGKWRCSLEVHAPTGPSPLAPSNRE